MRTLGINKGLFQIMRITKSFVDKVELPTASKAGKGTQSFFRDSAIPGFGLRVTSGGAKSFIVEKRIGGIVRRITLGRYGNLTVEQAKKEAMLLLGKVVTGGDPIAEKKEEQVKATSLKETFDDYLLTRKDLKEGTIKDYGRSMKWGFEDWYNKPVTEITKDMVELRHRERGKRSQARANNAMRVLRAIMNHARNKYEDAKGNPILPFNPVDRLSQNRAWFKDVRRQTVIKAHQLHDWFQGTQALNAETTRDYIQFLLFTGLRRSEASRLKWDHVDFKDNTFVIPETKNGQIHQLPMSSFVEELLRRRHDERISPYVFPSDSERGYLIEPKTAVKRVGDISGVPFTLHDLRRTFITIAESLELSQYAIKHLVNHKIANDVTAGYVVMDPERLRPAMEKITQAILSSINHGEDATA